MSLRTSARFWLNGRILFRNDGELRETARPFLAEVLLEGRVPIGGECWTLPSKKHNPEGYRVFSLGKRTFMGHRFSFQVLRGPIPIGVHVLHNCDNPPCSNPDHLRLGTDADNQRDKVARGRDYRGPRHHNSRKTHCPQGHEYTEQNVYRWGKGRYCKTCHSGYSRAAARERRARSRPMTGAVPSPEGPPPDSFQVPP